MTRRKSTGRGRIPARNTALRFSSIRRSKKRQPRSPKRHWKQAGNYGGRLPPRLLPRGLSIAPRNITRSIWRSAARRLATPDPALRNQALVRRCLGFPRGRGPLDRSHERWKPSEEPPTRNLQRPGRRPDQPPHIVVGKRLCAGAVVHRLDFAYPIVDLVHFARIRILPLAYSERTR